ncbi:MAG: ABC transporter permease subunit [Marmoricola sp.]
MTWFEQNHGYIWHLTVEHFWLSIIPIVAGFVIAVPLGWVATRFRRPRSLILSLGSLVYTIPSLPLLIVLPSVIGTSFLDPINVIIALTAYAAALLVHTAADAFAQVPAAVVESASASGYSRWQQAITVELPLAGPVLLAGVRVVSVSTVSIATIGPLIGVSNLGALFTDGFQRGFNTEIVIGVITVVALALVLDLLWVGIGRFAMPWQHARGTA